MTTTATYRDPADYCRKYLVANNVARNPNVAGSLPVVYVDLENGAPRPKDLSGVAACNTVVHISEASGRGTNPYEGFLLDTNLDIEIRSRPAAYIEGKLVGRQIQALLGDKQRFDMAGLDVSSSYTYIGLDRMLPSDEGEGYGWRIQFAVTLRLASVLA